MTLHVATAVDREYRALVEGAGVLERADRAHLTLRGSDAADYLQGQVTNDVLALALGEGCYAALLNPKGRILTDMRILTVAEEEQWLDLEAHGRESALRELRMYKIGRRVEIVDASAEQTILSVMGPRSGEVLTAADLAHDPAPAREHAWIRGRDGAIVVATDVGHDVLVRPDAAVEVGEALVAAGAARVSEAAAEIVRIEHGRPRYGIDMSEENLPGEAGIVDRAVSFTKGCYVGQEPVARMYHKGRPNRRLRGLELSAPVAANTAVIAASREVGRITSAAVSPARGPIALAILRREVESGDEVTAGAEVTARVIEPPFA